MLTFVNIKLGETVQIRISEQASIKARLCLSFPASFPHISGFGVHYHKVQCTVKLKTLIDGIFPFVVCYNFLEMGRK